MLPLFLKKYNTDLAAAKRTYLLKNHKAWSPAQDACKKKDLYEKYFHFSMPKMHAISHFTELIEELGTLDNLSTDTPELLHSSIKKDYRASNCNNYIGQMLEYWDRHAELDSR
jgi:hypothetical protein